MVVLAADTPEVEAALPAAEVALALADPASVVDRRTSIAEA